jgi:hypothetical protein
MGIGAGSFDNSVAPLKNHVALAAEESIHLPILTRPMTKCDKILLRIAT